MPARSNVRPTSGSWRPSRWGPEQRRHPPRTSFTAPVSERRALVLGKALGPEIVQLVDVGQEHRAHRRYPGSSVITPSLRPRLPFPRSMVALALVAAGCSEASHLTTKPQTTVHVDAAEAKPAQG